uniref:Uncharacterized protein n=1 Tax=Anguilla anguilla TaxID=7936 RepID=A0A0E9WX22_ANGAN
MINGRNLSHIKRSKNYIIQKKGKKFYSQICRTQRVGGILPKSLFYKSKMPNKVIYCHLFSIFYGFL